MTIENPRIGFGCASLGSRVSPSEGRRALCDAIDAGIDWFDVAPSYGAGQAETLLGEVLRKEAAAAGRPLTIVTKAGILAGRASLPKRLLMPAVRTLLAVAPGLRSSVKKNRPHAEKQPVTGALITQSIDESLARLGRERVDVLALHDASEEEVARDDVLRALEAALAAGKAAAVGIASSPEVARAGLAASPLYTLVQFANNPLDRGLDRVGVVRPGVQIVTHSVFGASGTIEALTERIAGDSALAAALTEAGYAGTARAQALAYLPDFAFDANPDGVVLLSMFSRRHLDQNLDSHRRVRNSQAIRAIAAQIAAQRG
jgi:aryl-alcohol dehydrogenase-like predicted oxidoreductase